MPWCVCFNLDFLKEIKARNTETILILIIFLSSDIDECKSNNGGCDTNAVCKNTIGSRVCECNAGFIEDGLTCLGKYAAILIS